MIHVAKLVLEIKQKNIFLRYHLPKAPSLYCVRVKGWMDGIAKYLLLLKGVGEWF